MSIDQIAILVALIIGLAGVCYGANEKIERTDAEAAYDVAIADAAKAKKALQVRINLAPRCPNCAPNPEMDRHVDQALEQAEPTPDLWRVK